MDIPRCCVPSARRAPEDRLGAPAPRIDWIFLPLLNLDVFTVSSGWCKPRPPCHHPFLYSWIALHWFGFGWEALQCHRQEVHSFEFGICRLPLCQFLLSRVLIGVRPTTTTMPLVNLYNFDTLTFEYHGETLTTCTSCTSCVHYINCRSCTSCLNYMKCMSCMSCWHHRAPGHLLDMECVCVCVDGVFYCCLHLGRRTGHMPIKLNTACRRLWMSHMPQLR